MEVRNRMKSPSMVPSAEQLTTRPGKVTKRMKVEEDQTQTTAKDEIMSPTSIRAFEEMYGRFDDVRERSFETRLWNVTHRLPRGMDMSPLMYWGSQQGVDPELAEVAAVAMALPVTNVTVERTFSNLPLATAAKKTTLLGSTINNLLVVNLNEVGKDE